MHGDVSIGPVRPAVLGIAAAAWLAAALGCSLHVGPPPETSEAGETSAAGAPSPSASRGRGEAREPRGASAPAAERTAPVRVAPSGAPVDVPEADPAARREFKRALDERPSAMSKDVSPPRVTTLALAHTAHGEARGAEGDAVQTAKLEEGGRAVHRIELPAGTCSTFIAQGGLGVVEVDVFLTVGAGAALRVLAEDTTAGPIAVIGGRGGCYRHAGPGPLEAELHVRVRRGRGVVLVQSFRREEKRPAVRGASRRTGEAPEKDRRVDEHSN